MIVSGWGQEEEKRGKSNLDPSPKNFMALLGLTHIAMFVEPAN